MAEFQISKIRLRRGSELDLPGKPLSLSPLTFESGLDSAELGFAEDTGRLFIGVSPATGQPNYKRTAFPYQNLEILTEASTDTLQRIFNFLERDIGGGGFYTATLLPTGDGDWQDVKVDRAYGTATSFRLPGEEIIALFDYHTVEQDPDGTLTPLRTGAVRFMSDGCNEECLAKDDSLVSRRLDFPTPQAMNPNVVFQTVSFRMIRGGGIGDRYFRLQYLSLTDATVKLWFRIERPLSFSNAPIDTGTSTSGSLTTGLSKIDIQQIVGNMVSGKEIGIEVSYDQCAGKINFDVENQPVVAQYDYMLNTNGDVNGSVRIFAGQSGFNLALTLAPSGVAAGRYVNPAVTVDSKGRVTAITAGPPVTNIDVNAIYNGQNLGSGADVFSAASGRNLQFRTITAGPGILVNQVGAEIQISANAVTTANAPAPSGPSTGWAYMNNGGVQTRTGTTAANTNPPTVAWSQVAAMTLTNQAPGQARMFTASAMIGAPIAGFPVARYLRLSVAGQIVYTAAQPWGEPWMGGQLTISWLDTNLTRSGDVPVVLDAAYVATNNGAPSFSNVYTVCNAMISVQGFVATASTASTATASNYSAPTTAIPASIAGSNYVTAPTVPSTAKFWRVNVSRSQTAGQNPGIAAMHFYDAAGALLPTLNSNGNYLSSPGATGIDQGFFNDNDNSSVFPGWQAASTTGYLGYQFSSSVTISKISMQGYVNQSPAVSPMNFTIENSVDGVSWNVVKTYVNADAALYHTTIYYPVT